MTISVRLCSGRTAFEVNTNIKIDLVKASHMIAAKVATKYVMILNYKGADISVYPGGKMLIKAKNKEESLELARCLLAEIGYGEI